RVIRVAVLGAHYRRVEQLLAHAAVGERCLSRLLRRVLQRDDPLSSKSSFFRRLCCRCEIRQAEAGELSGVIRYESPGLGRCKQLAREFVAQLRFFLIQSTELDLVGFRQVCACPYESYVLPLDEILLLGVEPAALAVVVNVLHACEEPGIEIDRIAVRGEPGSFLAPHALQRRIRVGLCETSEHALNASEQLAGSFERDDGVVERWCRALIGDFRNVGETLPHSFLDRRLEIGVLDPVERRRLERKGTRREKRILCCCGSLGGDRRNGYHRETDGDQQRTRAEHRALLGMTPVALPSIRRGGGEREMYCD